MLNTKQPHSIYVYFQLSGTTRRTIGHAFSCGSFHDAVTSSDYIASKGRMVSEERIGDDMERSGRGILRGIILASGCRNKKKSGYPVSEASLLTRR
jgi:hypothetical protein